MRDITLEDTIYMDFTTRSFSTGVPTQLAGTPALSVLEENNATPITSGVSVAVDRASVTGLNMATVVATAANGYEAGKGYSVYISTGTVGGVSVVGEKVGEFTIQANPVNWGKVTAPTTAVDLSGTDIQLCDTTTTNTDMITAAAVNAECDTAITDAALATAANLATVDTVVDAIKVVTDALPDAGALTTLQADTDDIQTRLPAALVGGLMSSDITAISTSTAAADNLEASAETIVVGAAATGTLSTTEMTTDLTEATNDHYNGRIIIWTSGVLQNQATNITDYVGTNGHLTFTAVTEAPSDSDTFVIV